MVKRRIWGQKNDCVSNPKEVYIKQGGQGSGIKKKSAMENPEVVDRELDNDQEEEEEDQDQAWADWGADDIEEEESDSDILCLFCDSKYSSCDALFEHCSSNHHFDFLSVTKTLILDFYGSFKLINFVRSRVSCHFFS